MEYISAEEFLKQSEEIQNLFIDWWEPSVGDLINKKVWIHGREYNKVGCFDYEWWEDMQDCDDIDIYNPEDIKQFVFDYIGEFPLLTEGQLRKFIEDKTEFPIQAIEFTDKHEEYQIMTAYKTIDNYRDFWFHERLGNDLLQAYWKVALEIAKECVSNE